jgi:capping protein beta
MEDKLKSSLNLIRRLPPSRVENSLSGLVELVGDDDDLVDELYTQVDTPLEVVEDKETNKKFVCCEYNRDGDSHRSPWSNKYYPEAVEGGFVPSARLRKMETLANSLFDSYRKMYFEGGDSSAYFFETDDGNFGSCWVIHKDVDQKGSLKKGWWDSTHVFEVEAKGGKAMYKLTTTVMISMVLTDDRIGSVDLSGVRTRQLSRELEFKNDEEHVVNMGKLLEETEQRVRNAIEGIYIQKTREIINGIRSASNERDAQIAAITKSLNAAALTKR